MCGNDRGATLGVAFKIRNTTSAEETKFKAVSIVVDFALSFNLAHVISRGDGQIIINSLTIGVKNFTDSIIKEVLSTMVYFVDVKFSV